MSDTTISGRITFTGLGSGTDFDSVVTQLMEVESIRYDQMETERSEWEEQLAAVQELNAAVLSLQSALEDLGGMDDFLVKSAASSDTDAVSATAGSAAEEGSYNVVVGQLAQNDVWFATGREFTSLDEVVDAGGGSLTIAYAGESHSIDVAAGTTLSGLISQINTAMGGDVKARAVSDGDGYYIELKGMDLGADNAVEIKAGDLEGLAPEDFERTQEARNAKIKVDGFPSGADNWIESGTNTVEDAVPGVSLLLKETTDDAGVTVTVSADTDAVVDNVRAFVDAVNEVLSLIDELSAYDEDNDEGSALTGNTTLLRMESDLRGLLSGKAAGFARYDAEEGTGDVYHALSQLGISTDADQDSATEGQLLLDEDKLAEALENDPEAVARLFAADTDGTSDDPDLSVVSGVKGMTQAGAYSVEYEIADGEVVWAAIDGEDVDIQGSTITGLTGGAKGLEIRLENLEDGMHDGEVRVRDGLLNGLLDAVDRYTNSADGSLTSLEGSFQSVIDSLDDRMANEEDRLSRKETSLREMYARLETTLKTYEGIQAQLDSSLSSLSSDE